MNHNLKILFIDDNSIDEEIDTIKRALIKNHTTIEPSIVSMKDVEFKKEHDTHGSVIAADKVQKEFLSRGLFDEDFDIVACDFNFSDPFYDGYKLLIALINFARDNKRPIRHAKFLFYTGATAELARVAGGDLKKLLPLKVEFIVDRENLPQELIHLINRTRNDVNLEKMFLRYLDDHRDKAFLSTFPAFSGKPIHEIAVEIEKESEKGKEFLKSLVEQSVSHLIALQED